MKRKIRVGRNETRNRAEFFLRNHLERKTKPIIREPKGTQARYNKAMAMTQKKTILTGITGPTQRLFLGVSVLLTIMTLLAITNTPAIVAEPAAIVKSAETAKSLTIQKVAYEGWQDAYRITNGTAEVIIVPQVARIMRYGYVGGPNLLWNNTVELGKEGDTKSWRNFGGDKAWPWSQDDWPKWFKHGQNWPPPPESDQMPQKVQIIGANTVRLTSSVIAETGLRIVRDITLAETGTRLYTVTKFERVEDGYDFPIGAWTITQTPYVRGSLVAHLIPGETTLAEGWRIMGDKTALQSVHRSQDGKTLDVQNDPKASGGRKLGFDGDAIAGLIGDTVLVVRAESPDAKAFSWRPGERGQIYVNDSSMPYMEWEFTSPMKPLKKGESVTLVTTFEARKLTTDHNTNEAVAAAARGKM